MKDIKDWEGLYAVTKNGRIWAYPRTQTKKNRWGTISSFLFKGKWMPTHSSKEGTWYKSVSFQKNWRRTGYKVHRLVAQTYLPNPNNLLEVNHKNGNKADNRLENLEWCNRKQNIIHGLKIKPISQRTIKRGMKSPWAKLTDRQVCMIRQAYKTNKFSYMKLGKKYKVSAPTIGGIINRIYWASVS